MPFGGGLQWLRARDPGLRAVRRSARVTPVACTGFHAARYGLGNHVAAVYALFGDRRLARVDHHETRPSLWGAPTLGATHHVSRMPAPQA
ncbi:hypothetical protein ABZT28_23255 [Streptomyces sp. NPDC005388]|uniref:hypothetical protein n=1 Tax=Streptomyces sp. NPDC005388 TaxID=3156717 RepID=UPI0033AA15A8